MQFSLTTPQGALVAAEVDEVVAPGALGEFGVLPGHVPFLSALKAGVLAYRTKDEMHFVAVSEGILEVAPTAEGGRVLALCPEAVPAPEIDAEAALGEMRAADAELATWKGDAGGELRVLQARRDWAAARADAASRAAPH